MIVRYLAMQEIKKIYNGRTVNENHRWEATEGCDYVVISINIGLEMKEGSESIRYWIINDKDRLLPYDGHNFKIIDSYFPSSWVMDLDERGIEISHPKWAEYGYAEDYFDNSNIEKEYDRIVKKIFNESIDVALQNGKKLNLAFKKNYRISEMLSMAKKVLAAKIPLIGGCSQLTGLLWKENMETNRDFFVFKRFCEEADHVFPSLEMILQRLPKADLKEKEMKIRELEKIYKDEIYTACRKLIELLER